MTASRKRQAESHFGMLVRLFAGRTLHGGSDAGSGELGIGLGVVLALLALPGGLYAICLFEKYSTLLLWMMGRHDFDPIAATTPDEYFFIVLSMFVTGAAAVWRWDSIFPDRRHFANLVPLPISTRTIFFANVTAIFSLALLLGTVVNAASAVIYPLAVSASQRSFTFVAQLAGIHALCVVLASLFSFFTVFAAVGACMVVLPVNWFRRVSLYVRGTLLVYLVSTLATSFAVPDLVAKHPDSLVRYLPPVWFLGLTQRMHGTALPSMAHLALRSLQALAVAVGISAITCIACYQRRFMRIPEVMDIDHQPGGRLARWWFDLCDRTILRTPYERGAYRFVWLALSRSEHHSMVLCGFFGLGLVVASQVLLGAVGSATVRSGHLPPVEALCVPLILSYCGLLGFRVAFEMPTELRGNWTFQLLVDPNSRECSPLARKAVLSGVLPILLLVGTPLFAYLWGWEAALVNLLATALWVPLLAQVLFIGFRKVPCTCSYPPFRDSALVTVMAGVMGFFVFVFGVGYLELVSLAHSAALIPLFGIPLLAFFGLQRLQRDTAPIDSLVLFEENQPSSFELLDLRHHS